MDGKTYSKMDDLEGTTIFGKGWWSSWIVGEVHGLLQVVEANLCCSDLHEKKIPHIFEGAFRV